MQTSLVQIMAYRLAISWFNAGILFIWPWGTNFNEVIIEIYIFAFKEMHLKMSSAKWRPFCLCLNVLKLGKKKYSNVYGRYRMSIVEMCLHKYMPVVKYHYTSIHMDIHIGFAVLYLALDHMYIYIYIYIEFKFRESYLQEGELVCAKHIIYIYDSCWMVHT